MSSVAPIGKDNTNPQQNFKYRGIDDVLNSLHKAFSDYGVFIRVEEIKTVAREEKPTKSGGLMVYSINDYRFVFAAADGSELTAWGRGEASDSADKSSNKAISAALKYCLLQMFLIPTIEEKDSDATHTELAQITAEHAILKIRSARDVKELTAIFNFLPADLQKTEIIIQEVKVRRAELNPPK